MNLLLTIDQTLIINAIHLILIAILSLVHGKAG